MPTGTRSLRGASSSEERSEDTPLGRGRAFDATAKARFSFGVRLRAANYRLDAEAMCRNCGQSCKLALARRGGHPNKLDIPARNLEHRIL